MFVDVNPAPHLAIHKWPDNEKPREKLINIGATALSDAELLAILLHTGHKSKSALELAKEILRLANNNLSELGKINVKKLQKLRGVGYAKAVTILAAMELARRRQAGTIHKKTVINNGSDAAMFFKPMLADQPFETFHVLFLSHANKVLHYRHLSTGGITSTVVDPRIIFREALDTGATKLLLCHNHPSGSLRPSQADLRITTRIKDMGMLFDIQVMDHIIVSETGYYSLAEEGMI
ncbi:DNA repair protein RadC [Chitinophaga ginsengisegetis]|uniref:DNA repair protein RadC n=1 Tax=Chitinophaga ginsengisegetis TaxID=393003 RepID=A0A1T5P2L9_9BACT|nr:DNA repair protein RadC [Chitinophaga ginsengisegetis]MDR6566686.1 DNA repair protein RadC [Chitinophaga ginsengisegetis]MDR6646416.1 DNA repair protein RadC [Chitinophaga ginsengisegetis]MDR6652766.1 DNA repair protein RadC [Chitinophaga ginsengisegetis]SKD06867.1 DNA repair protein RadC [Chitinophaga ginsengisegetis]